MLGWLDRDVAGGRVHLFSAAAPAAFLPTRKALQDAFHSLDALLRDSDAPPTDGSDYAFKWGDHDHYQFSAPHPAGTIKWCTII